MNTASILATLQTRLRGLHGHLPEVARLSLLSYSAVVQIARGSYTHSPSLKTVDKLHAACAVIEKKRRGRK